MIDIKKLKQLVALMVENDLTEVDLEGESEKVSLKRGHGGAVYAMPASAPVPVAAPVAGAAPAVTGGSAAAASDAEPVAPAGPTIDSPMVGTFYTAPSPDADDFVAVGAKVTADTVVCIIEAMKVFNEIKAECSGTIEEVLVESGQPVEFGQALYRIKPG